MTQNQISYWNLEELKRNNAAVLGETTRANRAREQETLRHNQVLEDQGWFSVREAARHNIAFESETQRSNLARESETNRSNLRSEYLRILQLDETERSNRESEYIGRLNAASNMQSATAAVNTSLAAVQNSETNRLNQLENVRSNLAMESLRQRDIEQAERQSQRSEATKRAGNLQQYSIAKSQLEETVRSHQAAEAEQHRANLNYEATNRVGVAARAFADFIRAISTMQQIGQQGGN